MKSVSSLAIFFLIVASDSIKTITTRSSVLLYLNGYSVKSVFGDLFVCLFVVADNDWLLIAFR